MTLNTRKQSRRWKRYALLLGIIGALIALLWLMLPHERLLTRDATPIATITDWKLPCWQWRSPHEIIYLRDDLAPKMTGEYSVWSRDTSTGNSTALAKINAKLKQGPGVPLSGIIGFCGLMQVSPDGKNLLWVKDPGPRPAWSWFDFNLESSRLVKGALDGPFVVRPDSMHVPMTRWAWTPDSKSWVALTVEGDSLHALLYGLDPPTLIRDISLNVPKSHSDPDMAFPTTCLGFTRDGRLLATYWHPQQTDRVDMFSFDLSSSGLPVHTYTIHPILPDNSDIEGIALSPLGDRLAWHLLIYRASPLKWLARWLPSAAVDPGWQDELWVSALDGSDMKRVGFQPAGVVLQTSLGNLGFISMGALRWTPDGKRLSYTYHDKLYTVPAGSP